VRDAHSLELETFAELGVVGVALLCALLGSVALSAQATQHADPTLTAGLAAALTVWAFHSAIDWDWEMPALTLLAVVLAGAMLARARERVSAS
jgi:O-antigen ligase